jgi:LCP family protein required for cell wall assembly
MVNVEWGIKKANSILAYMRVRHSSESDRSRREVLAMQDSVIRFADILGFEVDYWVTVNMRGFVSLIDAIDGVDFYVPVRMYYHDPYQDLLIDYQRGMHTGLTGQQALEILRFREYGSGDIGRINTQQLFLTAMIEQVFARRASINVTTLADVFLRHTRTDIPLNNLIWFGLRFLELGTEDITFSTMPGNAADFVGVQSYVTIYVDEWLEMVNTRLSPFSLDFTANDVSILTRGEDRRLYVTDGNWIADPSWGASSRGPNPNPSGGGGGGSGGSGGTGGSGGSGGSAGSGGSGGNVANPPQGDDPDNDDPLNPPDPGDDDPENDPQQPGGSDEPPPQPDPGAPSGDPDDD